MRIEILVDNEEPRVFSLNKPKLLIGSLESCDIILNAGGISRKHLTVLNEDENFFIIDQGSTNGSYINEERLIPGRKTSFTTFFPVRLGDNVLITLLSDDDADLANFHEPAAVAARREKSSPNMRLDSTRAIPLSTLQNSKTSGLVKKRTESAIKRKTDTKAPAKNAKKVKEEKGSNLLKIIPMIILAVGIYFHFFDKEEVVQEPTPVAATTATTQTQPVAPAPEVPAAPKIPRVETDALTPKTKFALLESDIHCTNDTEKYICDLIAQSPNLKSFGTVQVGTMMNIILDGQAYYDKARTLVPEFEPKVLGSPDPAEIKEYNENVNFVTILLFVYEGLPKTIDWEKLKDVDITFALKITHSGPESDPEGQNVIAGAFVPVSLKKFISTIEPVHLTMIQKYGARSVQFLRDYPVVY